jgi:hypothetical protein
LIYIHMELTTSNQGLSIVKQTYRCLMKFILTLTLSLMVAGCASTPLTSRDPGLYTIPAGSIVQLNQPLTIKAGEVSAGIQFGEPSLAVNPDEPHCKFEVNTILTRDVTLPAADYRITRVIRYSDPFYSHQQSSNMRVASSSNAVAWLAMGGSPDSHWYYTTVFRLESDAHPDIRQLVCGTVYPSGYEARDITINEFEALAGDVMSIRIAGK